jgi:hypothetical protein
MIELEGTFLESPRPNHPGHRVYHQLRDKSLLAVELSAGEMSVLRAKWEAKRLAAMKELNAHPLNKAAAAQLDKLSGFNPFHMASLDLAFHVLMKAGGSEHDSEMQYFAESASDVVKARDILLFLTETMNLTAQALAEKPPEEAGWLVVDALRD